ncbi:hypothetical protein Dsin_003960 [Dipteronia sinensis]|uniref:Uncharacterized protein n=1 Tax=Dipteronia sinensis TaxID=43782 RepID=A0AAE0B9X0_9ROSI|nr:hypothetical protein Dsin_003960 [Dipteronia sinensis]
MVGQTQIMSAGTAPRPPQSMPAGPNALSPNISNDWFSGRAGGAPTGVRAVSPLTPSTAFRPQTPVSLPFQPTTNDSKALVVSGIEFASDTAFGGVVFFCTLNYSKKRAFCFNLFSYQFTCFASQCSSFQHWPTSNQIQLT